MNLLKVSVARIYSCTEHGINADCLSNLVSIDIRSSFRHQC